MTQVSHNRIHPDEIDVYYAAGWWVPETLADRVADHSRNRPDEAAYLTRDERVTWSQVYDAASRLAGGLVDLGVAPGSRVGVWMSDSPILHAAFLALEMAGATIVGLGARSGERELGHVITETDVNHVITSSIVNGRPGPETLRSALSGASVRIVIVDALFAEPDTAVVGRGALGLRPLTDAEATERRQGPDALYLINSTSGTTGMPKCVLHTQNRWHYFHTRAARNGALTQGDVFYGAVPAPFGFGLWTSHTTPIILGAPTVMAERFVPELVFQLIEAHRVTVLSCVSTQFIMMLADPAIDDYDLSSLRVMFTGGEAVPYERIRAFEQRTGVTTLQFYGSNETGLLTGTTLRDTPERRMRTAGRVVDEMRVRLFDENHQDVTASGRGRPGCRGPATSLGYLDTSANDLLYTPDGWMLMADICEIDGDGYLQVVGRTTDLIIRGGKNIAAAQVEADVATHPAVAHCAAVAMADPIFGERVCVYVELTDGATDLTLEELLEHLRAQGVSKETFPERLIVLDHLPRSSGAKVAKGELRADLRRRLAREAKPLTRTGPA